MKYLRIFEDMKIDDDDNVDYLFWLGEWIKVNFGNYDYQSGQINYDYNYKKGTQINVNIFYSQNYQIQIDDMKKIVNFYNYLMNEKIIFNKSQFNIQKSGHFIVQLKIDVDVIINHPTLRAYKEAKKYNL